MIDVNGTAFAAVKRTDLYKILNLLFATMDDINDKRTRLTVAEIKEVYPEYKGITGMLERLLLALRSLSLISETECTSDDEVPCQYGTTYQGAIIILSLRKE